QAHHRVELDLAFLRVLADHLAMELALRRHVDHQVADHTRGAPEAAIRHEPAPRAVQLLWGGQRDEMPGPAGDAELRVAPLAHDHLAPAADPTAAEDRVQVHGQGARGVEHARAGGERAPLARGHERDANLAGGGAHGSADSGAARRRPSRPPRRLPSPAAAGAASRKRPIQATQSRSCPSSTSAAATARRTSSLSTFVMAEVMPAVAAMERNVAEGSCRCGRPNATFDAPHVVFTPSSSRRGRTGRKTCWPAVPIAPTGMTRGSTTTSSRPMP